MSITAKQEREERASIVAQMNEITENAASENRSLNSDELQKFDELDQAHSSSPISHNWKS
jgi:hypothetical protein